MSRFLASIQEWASKCPDRPAVRRIAPGGTAHDVTFGGLARTAERIAERVERSYPRDGFVPVYGQRSAALLAAVPGVLAAGRAFVCLNPRLKGPQLGSILESLGRPPVLVDSPAAAQGIQSLPGARLLSLEAGDGEDGDTVPAERAGSREAGGAAIGCCIFTSGSTGTPKGVMVSADDLVDRATSECEWFGLGEGDRILNVLPWSFDVGLNQVLSCLLSGATLVIHDSWLPADVMKTVRDHGITGLSAVPSVWRGFMTSRLCLDRSGPHRSLRYATVSGGDLLPTQLAALPGVLNGAGIFKTYGQSETFRSTCLRPREFADRPASVGRPFGGARVRIAGADGADAPPGCEGEIIHSGSGTMAGYLVQGRAAGAGLAVENGAPCVRTGDAAVLDSEGFLFLRGRRDGMLKIAGHRVYPLEIAQAVAALPGVLEAEVVGVADADGETVPFAFARTEGAAGPDAMRRDLSRVLPSYMVPRVVVLPSIPLMSNGKTDMGALAGMARETLNVTGRTGKRKEDS